LVKKPAKGSSRHPAAPTFRAEASAKSGPQREGGRPDRSPNNFFGPLTLTNLYLVGFGWIGLGLIWLDSAWLRLAQPLKAFGAASFPGVPAWLAFQSRTCSP